MSDILTPYRAIEDPVIIDLAKELGKDPAKVILSWISQRGVVVLPKSVTPSRIQSNLQGKFPSDFHVLPPTAYRIQGRNSVSCLLTRSHFYTAVFELAPDAFEKMASLDRNDRYNIMSRLGVDIFGDAKPGVLEKAEAEFKAANKKARGL